MNVWRWLGISIFLITTITLVATTEFSARGNQPDEKKVEVSADPDKATVKPGETKTVELKFKRGKDAKKEVTLTVEVDPKDKGVTAKFDAKDPKFDDKIASTKLIVESTDKADGDYKVIVKAKSEGSPDASVTFVLTAKKAEVAKVDPKVDPKVNANALKFEALDPKTKPFYTEQYTETEQTMTVSGQAVVQKQKQWFLIKWTPDPVDTKGNYVISQKIEGVKMEIDIGGNKIAYDSANPNKQKNPMTDFFDQLMKEKLTYHVKKDLTSVEEVDGGKKFIDGLKEINPQMQNLLKAILSDKSLQKMAEPTWFAFPPNGVVPASNSWTSQSALDLGPIGNYKTDFDFSMVAGKKDDKKYEIGIKSKLTYTQPGEAAKGGLPFVIHKAELKTSGGTGKAIFDDSKGRFESTTIEMNLTGELVIEVGNMKTTVTLNQKQTAKSTTYDTPPTSWGTIK
jgi:Family of unknown function (DUF6263)